MKLKINQTNILQRCETQQIYIEMSLFLLPNTFSFSKNYFGDVVWRKKRWAYLLYIFAVNCQFFRTYSIRICTLKLKSGILYQMNNTFWNTVFNISCCSFNIPLPTLLLYPAALSWLQYQDNVSWQSREGLRQKCSYLHISLIDLHWAILMWRTWQSGYFWRKTTPKFRF